MTRMKNAIKNLRTREEGHAALLGGSGLLTVIVVVLLLIWIF